VVPCCIFDECNETALEIKQQGSDPKENCNNCSPFSTCATCNYFTVNQVNFSLVNFNYKVKPVYNTHDFSAKSGYQFSFFKPPRLITLSV